MNEGGLKILKGAVIMGGVLLVVATIMLFVVLAKKIGTSEKSSCLEQPVQTLPEGATVMHMQVERDMLHVMVAYDEEQFEVITINRCSGAIIKSTFIKTENTPPPSMPFG